MGIAGYNGDLIQGNYIGTDKSGTLALPNGTGVAAVSNNTIGGASPGAGNVISGNAAEGINLNGNQNLVAGNLIGTTATGLAVLGNGAGIEMGGQNTIGGTTPGARNIISGNSGVGITIENSGNLVEGNFIGTDITGTTALGAQVHGIVINSDYNTIGGATGAARNIISGNPGSGIYINPPPAESIFGNVVQGNYIGTDATGTHAIPNGNWGIFLDGGATENTIGGTLSGEGNLVPDGIILRSDAFFGGDPSDNLIQGNLIGTDRTGTVALSGGGGIRINGADNNTIGGTTPGAGNTIAFNVDPGVDVWSGLGNSILGNSIFANSTAGIVLNSTTGANDNLAAPVLTSASSSGSGTTVSGTLQSVASTTFRVEFFANAAMDPSGYGQGQTYLGFATVSTDASGHASFTATFSTVVPRGYFISATATDPAGNTSQFSKDLVVGSFLVTNTCDSGVGSLREAIVDANTLADGTAANPDQIQFNIPTTDSHYHSSTGSFSIQSVSALPTVTDMLVLDGYTQPGASPNTLAVGDNAVLKIVLDGTLAGAADGLIIGGGNTTVRGLVIENFAYGSGIALNGSGNDVVVGSFIGTDVTGESAAANNIGIDSNSSGDRIGGTSPGDRNIISGNNSALPDSADGERNPARASAYFE
jgi:hypothetical protein